jgi:prepilin-type processing-associated H-X9-DG protein
MFENGIGGGGVGSITGALSAPALGKYDGTSDSQIEPGSAMVLGRSGDRKSPGDPTCYMDMFSSPHSGGVNFVFADGHVACLTSGTDFNVFESLSTRAGGEAVSERY